MAKPVPTGVDAKYLRRLEQQRASRKRWHERNPGKAKIYREEARRAVKKVIESFKDAPCMDCGGKFPPECMDFDHIKGEKSFNVGGTGASHSLERVLEEIEKCELVCSNCHRTRTRKRREAEGTWKVDL